MNDKERKGKGRLRKKEVMDAKQWKLVVERTRQDKKVSFMEVLWLRIKVIERWAR